MDKFRVWLKNAAIRKKFIPMQCFIIASVVFISLFSFFSVRLVNDSSESIIDVNVRHKEQLSSITRNMYVCRVLGRDILLQENVDIRNKLYDEYIIAFDELDERMDEFSQELSGERKIEFERIIEEKNIYKDSMILSADIIIGGGAYDDALYALQVVTPIANEFFGSIDDFSTEEERLLNLELERNDRLVVLVMVSGAVLNVLVIFAITWFTEFFSKNMSSSLVKLEKSMSAIAETGNMKIEIPSELYTEDEVGRIATVANNMKTMLLEFSFNDTLTGGLNAKAYHEELNDIFANGDKAEIWCVISDMNNLKLINDFLGHLEGDNAIRSSYFALDGQFKQYGKTFRIGGDEFVSILRDCGKEEIEDMIAKIKMQIEKANANAEYKFSVAFGYDKFIGNTILQYNEFFSNVDKKMYDNKAASKQSRMDSRVTTNDYHDIEKRGE